MKKNVLNLLLLLCWFIVITNITLNAQTPNYIWAKSSAASNGDANSTSISTDANGNSVVTGYFYDATITFGGITLTNTQKGAHDFFIVKYDSSGNVIWAKSAGGIGDDKGISVSTDANGAIYVTGTFKSPTIKFGTNTFKNNYSNCDLIFIVKYDSSGNEIWSKSAGGYSDAGSTSISVDTDGKVYLAGYYYYSTITFGAITLTNNKTGYSDIFIVKYDPAGNVIWAKSAGGAYMDIVNSVSTDAFGNAYMTGSFKSKTITFGKTILTKVLDKSNLLICSDIFIVKYDSSGNVVWAKSAGGSNYDDGTSVGTDANGNVLMIGTYSSDSIHFGKTTLINTALKFGFAGGRDIFIVKYDSGGKEIWVKSPNGIGNEYGKCVVTDGRHNIYISGYFTSDTVSFGVKSLINTGTVDMFLTKLDSSGNFLWAAKAAETLYPSQRTTYNYANSMSTDANDNIYFTGSFNNPSITLGNITLNSSSGNGALLVLIAKIDSSTILPQAASINKIQYLEDLVIVPNPFATQTTLSFNEFQNDIRIKIIDGLGKEVKSQTFSGRELTIEKGSIKEGIYFLQIIDDKNITTIRKMIVN